ncbi:hypothetical protein [Caballeronia sp. HLA56]
MNANGKVPVLTTEDRNFVLTESAANLVYLAEKTRQASLVGPCTPGAHV